MRTISAPAAALKSSIVEYCSEHDPDDSGYTIDWECPECGTTGKAGYTAVFDRHYKVQDATGNDVPGRDQ